MPFKVGDTVKYLNEKGGGVVLKLLENDYLLIEDEEGFEFEVKKSSVVGDGKSAIDKEEIQSIIRNKKGFSNDYHEDSETYHDFHMKIRDYLMRSKLNWTSKDKDFIEIDLHIEELVEKPKNLMDGQKLHYQLDHARHCLDAAMEMRIRRIVFIHGVGSGVLRHELRQWLKTLAYIEIVNANYQRYGIGATEIKIHGY